MNPVFVHAVLALGAAVAAQPEPVRPLSPTEAMGVVVRSNTAFAVDLHQQLAQQPGNLCYSPWSISTVLALTSAGAQGQTLEQMAKTLHLPNADLTRAGMAALLQKTKQPRGCELNAANAMFVAKDIPWRKDFLDLTRQSYGSSIFAVDFRARPDVARQSINTWVEGQTRKHIANLIPTGAIDSESTIVLVNAVYFKGQWDKPFKKRETVPLEFARSANDKVKTPTMVQTGAFLYGENQLVQVLGMPYKGNDLMMIFILPRERNGLAKVEKDLTNDHFETWITRLEQHSTVDVYLPRFKMRSEFSLKQTLSTLGMTDAFSDGADFGKMTTRQYPLKISEVRHKAFVELQEEGTEAAAATSVEMTFAASPPGFQHAPPRVVFRADHPFLFSIVDRRTGSLVFVGRVSDPTR
jgi:serpin B